MGYWIYLLGVQTSQDPNLTDDFLIEVQTCLATR